jgi:hemerythrin-like domain-containing protein
VFVLTEEHGVLRRLVARLEQDAERWERREAGAAEAVRLTGRQTIRAFQKHIYKENNIVFRLAESTFTGDDHTRLEEAFEKVLAADV